LIFFCFFSSIKRRKEDNLKTKNKKQIEYTSRTKPNWPASLTPWFSFDSFLASRQEKKTI